MRGDVVAFIGAGGKTSALIGLGYELYEQGWRVLTTTTHAIDQAQLQLMPHSMPYDANPQAISAALSEYSFVFLYDRIEDGKVYGPTVEWTPQLLDTIDSDVLLIEADNAAGRPLKAAYTDEPFIPREASVVISFASLAALDKPLTEDHIYNSQAMIDKYGFYEGSTVRSPWIAQILRDEELGLRGIPQSARVIIYINQTPASGYLRGRARLIARLCLQQPRIEGVALGSIRAAQPIYEYQRPIAAIVLAAGRAERMGEPKVLLPWNAQHSIIEHITHQLIRTELHMVTVVTGWYARQVKQRVQAIGATPVHNPAYKTTGMITSLQAGLRALPDNIAAALIVLGDQPRIQPKTIVQLTNAYAQGQGTLIAPTYQSQRGHPILVDRQYWADFLNLHSHLFPRTVIDAHQAHLLQIPVENDSILQDIDTPQDYHNARQRAGLT